MERSEEKRYAIEICDLVKFYGKKAGADGISLRVEEGDIFGFLGPNGAGKSTAIRYGSFPWMGEDSAGKFFPRWVTCPRRPCFILP